jgi:hypothetical protein
MPTPTTNDNDDLLRRALEDELKREPTMIAESLGVFTGRRRWWNVYAAAVVVAFTVLGVVAAVRFFGVEATNDRLLWATTFLFSVLVIMSLKVWFWLQMMRNAVLREVKRVELRLAEGRSEGPR